MINRNQESIFDGHSSTFLNRNGYWNHDYRLTSRILENNGTVVINELTGPKWLRRFMNRCFTKWPTGDHAVYSRAEMEQMLHTAGFQNIRSRMITPLSYVSVGRKTEEKPAMIKLVGLSDEQVTEIFRRIADAFLIMNIIKKISVLLNTFPPGRTCSLT